MSYLVFSESKNKRGYELKYITFVDLRGEIYLLFALNSLCDYLVGKDGLQKFASILHFYLFIYLFW